MKSNKKIITFIIGSILLLSAYFGMKYYNKTTLFRNIDTIKENYLAFNDLLLRDYDTKEIIDNPSKLSYEGSYDYYSSYNTDPKYITSKGIYIGCDYEEFIKQYGDYYAGSINAYDASYDEEKDDNYYKTHYISNKKVSDYFKEYIDTKTINLDETEISFVFKAYVKGNKVAYSYREYEILLDEKYDSFWPKGSIFNPKIQNYSLTIVIAKFDNKIIVSDIYTNRNDY